MKKLYKIDPNKKRTIIKYQLFKEKLLVYFNYKTKNLLYYKYIQLNRFYFKYILEDYCINNKYEIY